MLTRKYEPGYSKLEKMRRVEALIELAMNKFIKINKQMN